MVALTFLPFQSVCHLANFTQNLTGQHPIICLMIKQLHLIIMHPVKESENASYFLILSTQTKTS